MEHVLDTQPHPLAERWQAVRAELAEAPPCRPTGITSETYLDIAEKLARTAAAWQDRFGAIIDPYSHYETSTCTPRFVGTLGQAIGFGRCPELVDVCVKSYENCLGRISHPWNAPEFAVKELVLAHRALRDKVPPERHHTWEMHWRDYNAEAAYNCCYHNVDHNYNTFGLTGEFLRIKEGLGGRLDFVDQLIEKELKHVDEFGMYHDPGCPLTYHVVVMQQWALILMMGYRGAHYQHVSEAVRRGGLSSLLMQSCVGNAPFGGRSNQFHHCEAQGAALFEVCARLARQDGDEVLASTFKRAARRGLGLTLHWIMDMEPWRHLKQGFHPSLEHGSDSGGLYSVYGLLAGSLCGIATHVADESISEVTTPAEMGGYVFAVHPEFNKVFASCGGWSLEIDTKANQTKDSTGLGRVHRIGLQPEAILSGSIPANPEYSFALELPQRNVAIGPEWDGPDGNVHRLADFSDEITNTELVVHEQNRNRLAFDVVYEGDFAGVRSVRESYELDSDGIRYGVQAEPAPKQLRYTMPIIETDGDVESDVQVQPNRVQVSYRGGSFAVGVERGTLALTAERNTNRNATYRTAIGSPERNQPMALRIS